MEHKSIMSDQSIELSVQAVHYYQWLTAEKKEYIMAKQFLRAATSIGANIHEAYYASSKADFINKIHIALKEASETEYWLLILQKTGYFSKEFEAVNILTDSLKRMLVSTLNTSKNKIVTK